MDDLSLAMELPNPAPGLRWFAAHGCVANRGTQRDVTVGGSLIGSYGIDDADRGRRNLLIVTLASEPSMHLGQLAAAFEMTDENLRLLRRRAATYGLASIVTGRAGGVSKWTAPALAAVHDQFAAGLTPKQATVAQARRGRLSYQTIWREHQRWRATQGAPPPVVPAPLAQLDLFVGGAAASELGADDGGAADEGRTITPMVAQPIVRSPLVQHLGSWLMIALAHQHGLHDAARASRPGGGDSVRISLDAVIAALVIGEPTVEGVRRLATPTAPQLLRVGHTPTASGVRRRLWWLGEDGGAATLHTQMAARYMQEARAGDAGPAVFYVDNHMRPYTGKHTVRRGWRMQDRRVRPGTSDYYVHDEDGRPIFRVAVPAHDSLSAWLLPVAQRLREGLGEDARILLAFDRAGAFPADLAGLRDAGFECVTYERKPYGELPATAFHPVTIDDECVGICEDRLRNLGRGRGRVRRIAMRNADGHQVNFLAVSTESAARLVQIQWNRWRQENGFKHGVERWGINQLDGRKIEPYPVGTIIPNPARRRIERALRLARSDEGQARTKLADLAVDDPRRARIEDQLRDAIKRRTLLMLQRPLVPEKAPVEQTELANKLVRHTGELKAIVDTVRIVCANAEADLAGVISPAMRKPAEAKKLIANLLAAPGRVEVSADVIAVHLAPAANRAERIALGVLLAEVNRWKLTLPGDAMKRRLRFGLQKS